MALLRRRCSETDVQHATNRTRRSGERAVHQRATLIGLRRLADLGEAADVRFKVGPGPGQPWLAGTSWPWPGASSPLVEVGFDPCHFDSHV